MTTYKPRGNLKRVLDASKSGRLIPRIEAHLMSREPEKRDYTYLHPSDICKDSWCQRGSLALLRGKSRLTIPNTLSRQNVFDEGHFIHAKWQKYFVDMGVMYGNWEGLGGMYLPPKGDSVAAYREVALTDDSIMLRGRADGWIVGIGADCLIEIKSIGVGTLRFENPGLLSSVSSDLDKAWREIKRPFPSHLRQGQIYLELAHRMEASGRLERPAPKEIVFLYEYKPSQVYKEFVVEYMPEVGSRYVRRAQKVTAAFQDGINLPCVHGGCKECDGYE